MNIETLRSRYPDYSDQEILRAVQSARYPDYSVDDVAKAIGYKPPSRNLFAVANDTVIEGANAVAGGVGAAAEFVSPGNRFSRGVNEFIRGGEESQSDVVKAEKARFAQNLQTDEGVIDELGSVAGYVARNPVLTAAQAVGSFVGPGAAIKGTAGLAKLAGVGAKGVSRAGLAGGAAAGGAMSGGDAAGTAYDLVQQTPEDVLLQHPDAARMAQQGMPIEQIRDELGQRAGREASIIPALIGAAGGTLGAERLFAGAGRAAGGLAGAVRGGLSEALQEGVEEGATQFEGQRAAAEFNPAIDPTRGVAAAAGMGAVLGGATGGALGAITGPTPQQIADEATVRIGTAKTVDDAIQAFKDSQVPIEMPQGLDAEGAMTRLDAVAAADASRFGSKPDVGSIFSDGTITPEATTARPSPVMTRPPEGAPTGPTASTEADMPFSDRVLLVQEQLKDARTRQQIRDTLGPQGLNDISYYASVANDPNVDIPVKTRDRMLDLAQALLQRAQVQPMGVQQDVRQIGTVPAQPAAQPQPTDMGVAAGRVTPPTSVIEVGPTGEATPVVRAAGLVGEGRFVQPEAPPAAAPLALPEPQPYRNQPTLAERAAAFTRAERDRENAKRSQEEQIPAQVADQDKAAAARKRAATEDAPTAMQLAMQKAAQKKGAAKPAAGGDTMAQRADAMRGRNAVLQPDVAATPGVAPSAAAERGDQPGGGGRDLGSLPGDGGGVQPAASAPEPSVRAPAPVEPGSEKPAAMTLRQRAKRKTTATTEGASNATDQVGQQEGRGQEREDRDGGRKTAEAGGGDRAGRAATSRQEAAGAGGEGKNAEAPRKEASRAGEGPVLTGGGTKESDATAATTGKAKAGEAPAPAVGVQQPAGELPGAAATGVQAAGVAEPASESDPYAKYAGKTVEQQVQVGDTGKTATLRMDSGKALRQLDERESALKKLLDCLGSKS